MQIAETFRQQARQTKPRRKMTEAQKQKLHALAEAREQEHAALVDFAKRIAEIEPTLQNLAAIVRTCCPLAKHEHLQRRAWKLKHYLLRGYALGGCGIEGTSREINSPTELALFSELTRDEERMSEERFRHEWPHENVKPLAPRMPKTGKRQRASKRAKALVWAKEEKSRLQTTQIQ